MNIQLGNLWIGHDYPCRIIAECCQNHLGSLAIAMQMARQAKACGADIAKFQHPPYADIRRQEHALTIDEHKKLKDFCEGIGIEYLCTPFDEQTAQELNDIGVNGFKISRDKDYEFRDYVAGFDKPLILSQEFVGYGDLVFPTLSVDNLYLEFADGYSCHSPTIYPALAAIALGAKVVEKHVILDKNQVCPDQYCSIDFNQLKELVDAKEEIEKLL